MSIAKLIGWMKFKHFVYIRNVEQVSRFNAAVQEFAAIYGSNCSYLYGVKGQSLPIVKQRGDGLDIKLTVGFMGRVYVSNISRNTPRHRFIPGDEASIIYTGNKSYRQVGISMDSDGALELSRI